MRQFLLGKNVAYPTTALSNDNVVDGAIGFYFRKSYKTISPTDTGTEITKDCMLIVNRSVDKGGHVVIPIHKNKFSYVKGVYQAGKVFKQVFTIPAPTTIGEYSMIVALKGVGFNQRNKWTASVYVKDVNKTANELAEALAKAINNNTAGSKVTATVSKATATVSETTLTIDGQVVGMDYEVVPADLLTGLAATSTQKGEAAYGDAQYIIDLANKAAADAGFEYTYQEAGELMRPHYPLNPLEVSDAADKGFTIFTLSFAEPRDVKTRDEVVNQIVQVAFPTDAAQITTFETVCKALAG
ncbi:MAG: hypothetical protein ACLU0X_06500 [Lachnospiraceae bacterium]